MSRVGVELAALAATIAAGILAERANAPTEVLFAVVAFGVIAIALIHFGHA